jgi:NAD(P)H dehydrogenase (quinone)
VLALPYSLATPLSFVDLADVAEAAARVLTEDGHGYATYPLCGTDLLSGQELADRVAERSGAAVRGQEIPVGEFVAAITRRHPLPAYTVDSLYRLFIYYGLHGITGNANVLRWLLGREPGTFSEYVDRCLCA